MPPKKNKRETKRETKMYLSVTVLRESEDECHQKKERKRKEK